MAPPTRSKSKTGTKHPDYDVSQRAQPSSSADIRFSHAEDNTEMSSDGMVPPPNTVEINIRESESSDEDSSGNLTPTFSEGSIIGSTKPGPTTIDDTMKEASWKAFKLREKSLKYQVHRNTLTEYLTLDLIPRGLQIVKKPGVDFNSKEFYSKWDEILLETSRRLMNLLIEYYDKEIPFVVEEISKKDQEIQTSLDEAGWVEYNEMVKELLSNKEQELLLRRKRKIQRDKTLHNTPTENLTAAAMLKQHLQTKLTGTMSRTSQRNPNRGSKKDKKASNSNNDPSSNQSNQTQKKPFLEKGRKPAPNRRKNNN